MYNLKERLMQEKDVSYFFEITLPAAVKRNEVLNHILIICPYYRLFECFVDQLKNNPFYSICKISDLSDANEEDVISSFSNIEPGAICIQNAKYLPKSNKSFELFKQGLLDFVVDVYVGRGISKRKVQLDLPPFTWLTFVEKESDCTLIYSSLYEHVIRIEIDEKEICTLELAVIADEMKMKISQDAINYIALRIDYNEKLVRRSLRRISDFLLVMNIDEEILTKEMAENIMNKFM